MALLTQRVSYYRRAVESGVASLGRIFLESLCAFVSSRDIKMKERLLEDYWVTFLNVFLILFSADLGSCFLFTVFLFRGRGYLTLMKNHQWTPT